MIVSKKKVFPDHHNFNNSEIEEMVKTAKNKNIDLVTTLKDFVKIEKKHKNKIKVADLRIDFKDKGKFLKFLSKKLK